MIGVKAKIWYVKLYTLFLIGWCLLEIFAPDYLLEIDPSGATTAIAGSGIFPWVVFLISSILLYNLSLWGKYIVTILILLSYLPLSSAFATPYDFIWVALDGSLLYLLWFDKQVSRMFKL